MMADAVLYETNDSVATLTMNVAENRNALSRDMQTALFGALSRFEEDASVGVAVLTGAGPSFSAGANLKDRSVHSVNDISQYHEGLDNSIYDAVMRCPKPVIAAVNGPAVGAGATLALSCDARVASEEASFRWPMAALGIMPANGTLVRLARAVGTTHALAITLQGKTVSADEAYRISLVNEVTPPGELLARARAFAQSIAQNAPLSLQFIKEGLYRGLDMGLHDAINADRYRMFILYNTDDRKEASEAWREKRRPKFHGH